MCQHLSNIPKQQFFPICYSLLVFLEGETAAVSAQCQPVTQQSMDFIYRREGVGFGGVVVLCGFLVLLNCLISQLGKEEKNEY